MDISWRAHSGPLVEPEAHVLRGKIQYAIGVVGKLLEVWIADFFAQKK